MNKIYVHIKSYFFLILISELKFPITIQEKITMYMYLQIDNKTYLKYKYIYNWI